MHMQRYIRSILIATFGFAMLGGSALAQQNADLGNANAPGNPTTAPTNAPSNTAAPTDKPEPSAPAPAAPTATAGAQGQNGTNDADQQFVKDAYNISQGEVELAKLALQKASTPQVRQFAQRMLNDHTTALNQLQQTAQKSNVTVPDSLDSEHLDLKQKLSGLNGKDFDDAYLQHMVAGHGMAISAFAKEIADGQNAALKGYAERLLPQLEAHETMAVHDRDAQMKPAPQR